MASQTHADVLTEMAEEIMGLRVLAGKIRHSPRHDLSETEFLALDLLSREGPMTVGRLQRHVRVLPAQMSRVMRSLESKFEQPLVRCRINAQDRRKIDVELTEAGRRARRQYRDERLAQIVEVLSKLPAGEIEEFMRLIRKMHKILESVVNREEAAVTSKH